MHRYLKLATKNALAHEYEEFMDYKLAAVIVKGGCVIGVGYNKSTTNAFVEHYTDKTRGWGRNYSLSTHAEMDVIAQARAKTDLRGSKLFVCRIRPPAATDVVGLARPCRICQNVMDAYGIRKAYYTIDDNNYGVMRVTPHSINDEILSK